ncbi:hypothetical protein BHE74_00021518 [Ensete ventricosum]|nr:hypothetical protein BHE74_00021518 [Ensete ventricosum]
MLLLEMRKLRKMGHITIVGPSNNIVNTRLDSLLERKTPGSHGVVATVAIGNATNAALLAVRILTADDADLWNRSVSV